MLVTGRPVNHVLHVILTLVTCFTWGLIWATLVLLGGEKREIANVDEWGNVTVARVNGTSGKLIALVVLGVFATGFIGFVILTAIGMALQDSTKSSAGSISPKPAQAPEIVLEVNAEQIWNDYHINETAANFNWKGKRLLVTLQGIDEIEDGGKVRKHIHSSGSNYIQLDFTSNEEVIHLTPGESVRANCKLDGFQLDSWLEFGDCRLE